ncbi:MAG TPA: nucleoside diphosphate kinase regulator [Rubricoccaceae bacterium]|jgi:regulator of nucleoside diphosphate kinase|nr:nucleoside diphosphate kinase regulator [Rubricoccaceae bacterium]
MQKTIYVTEPDRAALSRLITSRQPAHQEVKSLVDLKEELERAVVVPPEEIPPYVVTLNSRVRLRDLDTGDVGEYTLVMPGQADIREGKVSVLAPVGTALLGQQEEDVVEWVVPAGRKRFRIEAVMYQPERAGTGDLWPAA